MEKRTGEFPGVREWNQPPLECHHDKPVRSRAKQLDTHLACMVPSQIARRFIGRAANIPRQRIRYPPGANSWWTWAYPCHVRLRGAHDVPIEICLRRQASSSWCMRKYTGGNYTPAGADPVLKATGNATGRHALLVTGRQSRVSDNWIGSWRTSP